MSKVDMGLFNLENQWQLALERFNLAGVKLPEDQYTEIKRFFYAGLAQMYFLIKDDLQELIKEDETKALHVQTSMLDQMADFWKQSIQDRNKN